MWNRLKAGTGMAMSALGLVFGPGDNPVCGTHGVRLRTMVPQGCYWQQDNRCPVCERRTMTMKAYPFKMYFSTCGLIWTAAIVAVVFGVAPQVRTAIDRHAESKAAEVVAVTKTVDAMPQEWGALYRMLSKVHIHSRTEAFMDFLTGSREFKAGKRSPVLVSMPPLGLDGIDLFMGLFWLYELDDLMPVIAKLAAGPHQQAP